MTYVRVLIYSFVNRMARLSRQEISRNPQDHQYHVAVEGGSDEDLYLHDLLNQVEEDALHRAAEKLRQRSRRLVEGEGMVAEAMAGATMAAAGDVDPFKLVDGVWTHKETGQPVSRWNDEEGAA